MVDNSANADSPYMTQLDGLRAIAVLAVLLNHYTRASYFGELGMLGVQCFFVISGFLITGILLKGRQYVENGLQSAWHTLRQFYIRRFLRIFPIYYLTLILVAVSDIGNAREAFFWHLAYATNIYLALNPVETVLNSFWSLSVEEQFYILWPCVMLFTPRRYLFAVMVAVFLLAPGYRFMCSLLQVNSFAKNFSLFSNTDSLAIGAILALCRYNRGRYDLLRLVITRIGPWVSVPVLLIIVIAHATPSLRRSFPLMYSHLLLVFLFVWMVDQASCGIVGIVGKVLSFPPLLYIGKISYGIYLFHHPMMEAAPRAFAFIGVPFPATEVSRFMVLSTCTIGLAALSWRIFESPINDMKRKFPYKKPVRHLE